MENLRKNSASRSWILTLPEKEYDEKTVRDLLSRYTFTGQLETGEKSGYRHWQILIENPTPIRFQTLRNLLPKGHYEPRKGTLAEALAYVLKDETSTGIRVSNGEIFVRDEKAETTLQRLHRLIVEGHSVDELIMKEPSAMYHARSLERLARALRNSEANELRQVKATYIHGATGVGKTRSLWEKYGADMYRVSNYSHPWDSYKGQKVLVLDEFYDANVSFDLLLNILDVYPLELPARYENKHASWESVYLVSNVPLDEQYKSIQLTKKRAWDALVRRLDGRVYEFEDWKALTS